MNSILKELLALKTNAQVAAFLDQLDIADSTKVPGDEKYVWRLVGGDISNASHIHLAQSSVSPIVERIINSYDACIELKEYEEFGDKAPIEKLPPSPRSATEKWFNVPKGDLAVYAKKLNLEQKNEFGNQFVHLIFEDSGNTRQPTLIIKDWGIGQHPIDFNTTLVQLGKSNKMSSPHLHGNYGHGGASAFRYCKYSVIISRRARAAIGDRKDSVGWTIVRKNEDYEIWDDTNNVVQKIKQPPVYQYLSLRDGQIPSLDINGDSFESGTYVAHIEYDAREWQNISFEAWRALRNHLFDPVLPFKLIDERPARDERARNMFGARSTLVETKDVVYNNEVEEHLPDGGILKIRYWLLYDAIDKMRKPLRNYLERDNSKDTIILTLNGQRHSVLSKGLIVYRAKLPRISDTLLVQILVDDLTREMKGGIFTAAREGHSATEIQIIEQKLIEALSEDDELKEWEKKLGQIKAADKESLASVRKILNKLLQIGRSIGLGGESKAKTVGGVGTEIEYMPLDPPTKLGFLSKKEILEITQDKSKTITLELNGPDNLFSRRVNRGKIEVSCPDGIAVYPQTARFCNGRLPLVVEAKGNTTADSKSKIKLVFKAANLPIPLQTEKEVVVIPAPIFVPVDPPTEIKILRNNPILVNRGDKKVIPIAFNGMDDVLTRSENQASFNFLLDYPNASFVRRFGPKNGKIQITIMAHENAKVGDQFKIGCRLSFADGTLLEDYRNCSVIEKTVSEGETPKGAYAEAALPNYDIKPIYQGDWPTLNWNEEDVGRFDIEKDDDGKDKLILYVNMDNADLKNEEDRRIREGTASSTLDLIKDKYMAYIGYHLYLQYDYHKDLFDSKDQNTSEAINREKYLNSEQKDQEMKRVGKTILFSLGKIKDTEEF
jgi:hypothetical protein